MDETVFTIHLLIGGLFLALSFFLLKTQVERDFLRLLLGQSGKIGFLFLSTEDFLERLATSLGIPFDHSVVFDKKLAKVQVVKFAPWKKIFIAAQVRSLTLKEETTSIASDSKIMRLEILLEKYPDEGALMEKELEKSLGLKVEFKLQSKL